MRERELDPDAARTYRTGLWCTVAYLAAVLAFVGLDAIFAFTQPSAFTDSLSGILAPIVAVWGVMAARASD